MKAGGSFKVEETEIDFPKATPPVKLPYKDIAETDGDACHVKVSGLLMTEQGLEAEEGLKLNCCLELNSKTGS